MAMNEGFKLSRIGKLPIKLPSSVKVALVDHRVTVTGPKGKLERRWPADVDLAEEEGVLRVAMRKEDRSGRAKQGLMRALLNNMVLGVAKGFERQLEVIGVGYRCELKDSRHILFSLGYSHPILFELPSSVTAEVSKDNKITLRSIDKEELGLAAAKIRSFRPPEPYKGKGVKYAEETIRRKAGKAAVR